MSDLEVRTGPVCHVEDKYYLDIFLCNIVSVLSRSLPSLSRINNLCVEEDHSDVCVLSKPHL